MTNDQMPNEKEIELRVELALAQKDAAEARAEVKELRDWCQSLEERSGLMSGSLMARAFTVWGYYLLATISVGIPIGLIIALLVMVSGLSGR